MRYVNIKKAIQDEQQNQKTTTNINYIKNFVRFKKQNLITVKTQIQQNDLSFTRKDVGRLHIKAW